ncbi:MAG: N-glycosylase/DNA lyase [Nanohaloarchaea archaeon]|nr:N-glycosylase/DNA lyase [Candidatus Nanohaloarchaea archaeon]
MYKNSDSVDRLKQSYIEKKDNIDKRLNHFKSIYNKSDNFIFKELCFCLLTPQSKARTCDIAVEDIYKNNLLFRATEEQIKDNIKQIRFKNNKARYIILARDFFTDNKTKEITIKTEIDKFENNTTKLRNWLIKNIKGMGMKEASHFLRNIGKGDDIAILDRHILKNLKIYNIIDTIPTTITPKKYTEIETLTRKFSKETKIPMDALDLLFWSNETGEMFK